MQILITPLLSWLTRSLMYVPGFFFPKSFNLHFVSNFSIALNVITYLTSVHGSHYRSQIHSLSSFSESPVIHQLFAEKPSIRGFQQHIRIPQLVQLELKKHTGLTFIEHNENNLKKWKVQNSVLNLVMWVYFPGLPCPLHFEINIIFYWLYMNIHIFMLNLNPNERTSK